MIKLSGLTYHRTYKSGCGQTIHIYRITRTTRTGILALFDYKKIYPLPKYEVSLANTYRTIRGVQYWYNFIYFEENKYCVGNPNTNTRDDNYHHVNTSEAMVFMLKHKPRWFILQERM